MAPRVLHEPGTYLQVDQFEWKHQVLNSHVLSTIMVDAGSRAASVTIHGVMDVEHGLGNVTGGRQLSKILIWLSAALKLWTKLRNSVSV